ncbi:DUF3899 domain-containing protein [Fictibacillus terranigra]|uniref:DUF3899 domain-containing protein n=1 Tax=Fictibacillus terranigra TaxID=3058424 RepID=A0ABT8EC66_9BACL|nr:DUF3899 domain-containing protein [Fictibacillus sp. CENA-BCM004]MDN4075525.1 DUF3899 domain-containing protein [Fictibacillus sp. CENA-BCM004]
MMRFIAAALLTAGGWKVYMLLFDITGVEAINQSFLLGLLFLMAGAGAVIQGTGFLEPLRKTLKAINPAAFRRHRAVSLAEKEIAASLQKRNISYLMVIFLGVGTGLSACSVLLFFLAY